MMELESTVRIGKDSPFFDGHFPSFKLFPAVAQLDMVVRMAGEALKCPIALKSIKRVKFIGKILPDTDAKASVKISPRQENGEWEMSFTLGSGDGSVVYSQGTAILVPKS